MQIPGRLLTTVVALTLAPAFLAVAQPPPQEGESPEPATRQEILLKQREEKSRALKPYKISPPEERVQRWEKMRLPQNIFVKGFHGFRPLVGGMPSGSGFVVGGGYIAGVDSEVLQFSADARVSTKGYTAFDVEAQFPTRRSQRPLLASLEAGYRDFTACMRSIRNGRSGSASIFVREAMDSRW